MTFFLVTVKLPHNPAHDPHNKKTGPCPLSIDEICTDNTGEHHTRLVDALDREAVERQFKNFHITRIETCTSF